MTKTLIVNADDFAGSLLISKGIILAHKHGILKSTTVLTERGFLEQSFELLKECPDLKTGLHIDLDQIFIMKEPKKFYSRLYKITPLVKEHIKAAVEKQLEKFLKAGFKLSHFDSHHHAHMHPEIFPVVLQKAKEFNVPMRFYCDYYTKLGNKHYRYLDTALKSEIIKNGVLTTDMFFSSFREFFKEDFNSGTAEIMVHPGFVQNWQKADFADCCNPEIRENLLDKNIKSASFEYLKKNLQK